MSIDLTIAQVVSSVNSIRGVMPLGIQPPVVMSFSASSQPEHVIVNPPVNLNEGMKVKSKVDAGARAKQ